MTVKIRLLASPGADAKALRFALAFAAPDPGADPLCAPATLDTGDGQTLDLGLLCGPTAFTWREQRRLDLGEHRYTGNGPYTARLHWDDAEVDTLVDLSAPTKLAAATPKVEVPLFAVKPIADQPLQRQVAVQVTGLQDGQTVRLDGGAGQVHTLAAGAAGGEAKAEWALSYPKPGPYQVGLDLLDGDGFWLATLAETPLDIPEPLAAPVVDQGLTPKTLALPSITATDVAAVQAAEQPWLPYRYARPVWGWSRTYTSPGGSVVARVVGAGTYLGIHAETLAGGALWYLTGSGDWIPASSVSLMTPSTLRGVQVGETAPPPPPPPPPAGKRGVVTADVLNVRAQPGVRPDNPPVDQLLNGAEVSIYEQTVYAGAVWYRIGTNRWVYGEYIRLLDSTPPPPPPPPPPPAETKRGVVTATVLNVRAKPGVRADNPPVAQLQMGAEVTIFEEQQYEGATWYRVGDNRWVHSGWIRITSSGGRSVSGLLASASEGAMSLPLGFVVAQSLNVRARPGVSGDNPPIDQVFHNQTVPVLASQPVGGVNWYRIGDNRWVEGSWIGVARSTSRPSQIGAGERWVGVSLKEQTAVAYEGDRPVYAMLAASGLPGTPTVQGIFRTWRRLPTGKMIGGNPQYGSYYYLEDVTWTCYFYSGYALHTAYWHDAFGRPRSHGCVNLSPYDAWWIYEWSAPGGPNSPSVYVYWA